MVSLSNHERRRKGLPTKAQHRLPFALSLSKGPVELAFARASSRSCRGAVTFLSLPKSK